MLIGNREFDTKNRCYIMAILNVTPDSFSDGGHWLEIDEALRHTANMISYGADIIDVGGKSTRPGHKSITIQEEIDRAIPVVDAIRSRFDIPISIDTSESIVADAALNAGAALVNDIWGLKSDANMAKVISRSGAACCLMHNRKVLDYTDFIQDVIADLKESANLAIAAGIAADKIILDPGIGFAKSHEMNLEAINKLDLLTELGYPVLLGTSRKSVVGLALDLPVTERMEGTLATTVIGIMRGISFVRVHDVRETKRVIKMTEAVIRSRQQSN